MTQATWVRAFRRSSTSAAQRCRMTSRYAVTPTPLLSAATRCCSGCGVRARGPPSPRAVATAVAALQATFDMVVCDCNADLEGQADSGSLDVESAMRWRGRPLPSRRGLRGGRGGSQRRLLALAGDHRARRHWRRSRSRGASAEPSQPRRQRAVAPHRRALSPVARRRTHLDRVIAVHSRSRTRSRACPTRPHSPPCHLGDPLVSAYGAVCSRIAGEHHASHPESRPIKPGELVAWQEEVTAS